MSLTDRDGPALKAPQSDTTDTGATGAQRDETMTDPAHAARDVVATLCRMSLLRNQSLSVNGAYARSLPEAN